MKLMESLNINIQINSKKKIDNIEQSRKKYLNTSSFENNFVWFLLWTAFLV
jgi:hypothetical protein